jgi:hypothetical protein
MEELDLLKKDWQKNDHSSSQFSETEIYKMLHRKSSSIVKWILVISILEILLWTILSVCFSSDDYFKSLKHDEILVWLKILTYFNYAVILFFIYLFYKNYINISTTASTKKLMKDILKTQKSVQYYVWYNLGMILFSFMLGIFFAFTYNPDITVLKDKINHNQLVLLVVILVLIVSVVVILGSFWLFYKLLYGILLKKLTRNYEELKKIDL